MKRLPDWYARYVAFIETARRTSFVWGTHDCALFAGQALEAITGIDPTAASNGKYSTERGALLHLKRTYKADNLKDAVAKTINREPQHVSLANIGDVAAIKDASTFGYSLGVVNGERIFVRRPDGIGTVDLLEAECIFKI